MKLLTKLFPNAALLDKAEENAYALAQSVEELKEKNVNLWKSNTTANTEIANLRAELETTKAKVREQTDADLMLVSARILFAIAQNKKPEQADAGLQLRLIAQQQSMAPQSMYSSYGHGLAGLGALGTLFS